MSHHKAGGFPIFPSLIAALMFLIALFSLPSLFSGRQDDGQHVSAPGYEEYASNLQSGGPPPDGIPPLEKPDYQPVAEVGNFLDDKDVVFVVDYKGTVRMYPQKILVWHEIVNEQIAGERLSLTYCPLTGSAIGYKGFIGALGKETTYGTSGKLLNSNLVMYERATGSLIPQVLGIPITGQLAGTPLETFPVIWTTWGLARQKYPEADVLTRNTGFLRNYGRDPYGSYLTPQTYYDSGGALFPVMREDSRLPQKEVVIGIRVRDTPAAISKSLMRKQEIVVLDTPSVVALYDPSLDTVRVFSRLVKGEMRAFRKESGRIVDGRGTAWDVEGKSGEGSLERIDSFDVMWFAWVSFFPDTRLVS